MADSDDHDICAPLGITMDEASIEQRPRVQLMAKDSADVIARRVRESGFTWAWVEGFSQAGKSSFANKLSHALGWGRAIHLDTMTLEMDKQPQDSARYADHLDRDRIFQEVESGRPLVVEGVCLRDVVEGMRTSAAHRIYVARVSRPGKGTLIWHDGVEMADSKVEPCSGNWLMRDIIAYHYRVRPHATSESVLVRIADDL